MPGMDTHGNPPPSISGKNSALGRAIPPQTFNWEPAGSVLSLDREGTGEEWPTWCVQKDSGTA